MQEIYFDNSATTKVYPEVAELVQRTMLLDYGNPSSKHRKGLEAEQYFRNARARIAETLRVKPREIYFTSGGTESNNTAIFGTAFARRRQGKHIIASGIEHAAVYKPLDALLEMDPEFELSYLPVDAQGHISLEELKKAIRPDTILVSVMYVNNEIGTVAPVAEIGRLVKECNPNTLFHSDAIQAYGKFDIRPKRDHIDMISVSGHKLHGPKGIGFLYISENVHIKPILYGGGQQEDMRSGTHNVPGIAGLGLAAELACRNREKNVAQLFKLKRHMIEGLKKLPEVRINSEEEDRSAPQIVSASFKDCRAEVLLHALEEKGIYVSSGSACASNHPGISGTLKAIGLPGELLDATIRFSFSEMNTEEEVDLCLEALKELLPMLRRFTRR